MTPQYSKFSFLGRHKRIKLQEMQKDSEDESTGKSSLPGITRGRSKDAEKGIN